MRLHKQELLASLPPEWPEDLGPQIQEAVLTSGVKVVVLDDDPTGTQTVHDVPVLTRWSEDALAQVLREPQPVAYILTNSRSLPQRAAVARYREIARRLKKAAWRVGREFVVVSRSDSTLRGHFPAEIEALTDVLSRRSDATLLVPFFFEGGRLTANDVHYVVDGDELVPAAETEYARDASFGYRESNLRRWVAEKSRGRIPLGDITSISLKTIRQVGPNGVAAALQQLRPGQVCAVNATTYRDVEVFVAGLLRAERSGQRFIYRSAASFVRVRGGITPRPLLTPGELPVSIDHTGGLVVVGSYVDRSSRQIDATRGMDNLEWVELDVNRLLRPATRDSEIERVTKLVSRQLEQGVDALVFTSRQLVTAKDANGSLRIGQRISDALVAVVDGIQTRPAWVIAKGGITSSDVATKSLAIERAQVLGQAIPGIPVWHTAAGSRWPGLTYVVFPGNVGGDETLVSMIEVLRQAANHS